MSRIDPRTRARSRRLRSEATASERELWQHLRRAQIEGMRFRRQQPIGPYIVDFACLRTRIVVELDGIQHAEPGQQARDAARDRWLAGQGFTVVRIDNGEATGAPDLAVERIRAAVAGKRS